MNDLPAVSTLSARFYREAAKTALRFARCAKRDGRTINYQSDVVWRRECLAMARGIESGAIRYDPFANGRA